MIDKLKEHKYLITILILAAIVRLAEVRYGLPLWLVDDEPSVVLAALKMIQLKTLIPAFHMADFQSILYYPPYLSYLYLIPFSFVLVFKYLAFHASGLLNFTNYLLLDLSAFFITARLINILFALASIYLVYKTCENLFGDRRVGLASAFLLATNIAHIEISSISRHWLAVSFISSLIFYILSKKDLPTSKKYLYSLIAIGIGFGLSSVAAILLLPVCLWLLLEDHRQVSGMLKNKNFYLASALFLFLIWLPILLYPASLGFQKDVTLHSSKTILGLLASPALFLKTSFMSGPIFILLAILGGCFLFKRKSNFFYAALAFICVYGATFYMAFRYEDRFTAPLIPTLAILAGYGLVEICKKFGRRAGIALAAAILSIPTVSAVKFGALAIQNDTRISAINWAESNIQANSKVLVYARLTRLPSNESAIAEQTAIQGNSTRKVDGAEAYYNGNPTYKKSFHAINLYTISDDSFYKNINQYAEKNGYQYLLMEEDDFSQGETAQFSAMKNLAAKSKLIASFGQNLEKRFSFGETRFAGTVIDLFSLNHLGPPISIYQIKK